MSVAGLVSIPGMMTGQVLGGTAPVQAALYQVFIFYLISSSTFLASTLVVFLSFRSLVDGRSRVVYEKLKKDKRAKVADLFRKPYDMLLKRLLIMRCCCKKASNEENMGQPKDAQCSKSENPARVLRASS